VDGVFTEGDQFHRVPFAIGLLVVGLLDAPTREPLRLREIDPFARGIVIVQRGLRAGARLRADGDGRADGVEIADVFFLDLQLDRSRPGPAFRARFRMDVIEQAAVARDLGPLARRPLLLAPLELHPEVVVLERFLRAQLAEDFTGDADRGAAVHVRGDGEDPERVAP
jgi:hypothetical protein